MSSGAKKEKSLNGTKAKFSPNAAVQEKEKKAEVKLRRKESEKVKQPSDSNRKSVLGRFFHNLVDSDDSRKKAASADAKKKKGRDPGVSDLDLPEHGIMLRNNTQTLQRDQPQVPSPRARAMTLTNQSRDSRNRWSSYDIQACNFTEGMLPPTVPETDCSTLGHRSLSEETLNASLSADPRPLSKITDSFINHSDSARQPDAMRKHAQLLQSIQETKANRLSRSDKTIDARVDQSSNGYRLTTEMVIDGQKKDTTSITGHNTDRKLNDLQKTSSCDSVDGNRHVPLQNQTATSSSDALVLLNEKSKQIDKAIADKRRILSQLFSVTEDDLSHLLEKNVDLSADLSIRKMILISLLQSDRLTSVISSLLVPLNDVCTDGAVDKEAAVSKGEKCLEDKASSQCQLLHEVAFRLHSHMALLQQMMDRDVAETDRLKKDLEEAQQQIRLKSMPAEAKLDLSEASLSSDEVVQQKADLNVSTEVQGNGNESEINTVDNVTDSGFNQETQPTENGSLILPAKKEEAEENFPLVDELLNNSEQTKAARLSLADIDVTMDMKPPSDVSQNISPCINKCIDTINAEIYVENKVIVLSDKDTVGEQQESVAFCEIREELSTVLVSSDRNMNDITVHAEVNEDNQTDLQDVNDDLKKLVDEADEVGDQYHSDSNRKFMNLESIPEDDDRLSCDVELKVSAYKNLDQEPILKDGSEVTFQDDVQITVADSTALKTEGEAQSTLNDDTPSNVEDDMQSSFNEDLLQSADDAQSDAAEDMQVNLGDAQSRSGDEVLSNMQDSVRAIVGNAPSDVQDDALLGVTDTPLHANDDTQSTAVDDAQSDVQDDMPLSVTDTPLHARDDTQSSAIDDAQSDTQDDGLSDTEVDSVSNLDEIQTNVADGENSCQVINPVIIAEVDLKPDGDLQNCLELESTSTEEESPQIYNLVRPENLESTEENQGTEIKQEDLETDEIKQEDSETDTDVETENLESKIKRDLETFTDMETSMQLENKNSTESENDDEESEDERRSESDVVNILELSLLESELNENLIQEAERRLPIESRNVNEQIPTEPDIGSNELTELGEISHSDILLEERKTAAINEPKTVVEGLLHNHVENKIVESNEQENSKSEIAEAVNESLDLSECDKVTIVSSGTE